MNMPVLVDWLTLLLAPIVFISLSFAFAGARSSKATGGPLPGWAKLAQGVGILCALLIALLWMLWGG
jgi:hypothetical protein